MRHFKLLHPRNYISSADLDGKDVTLTIQSVAHEDLVGEGGRKDNMPVITFDKAKKKMVLNRTNAKLIASQHGPDVDGWTGKQVTLYPTTVRAKGESVEAIRIRPGTPIKRAGIVEEPTK